MSPTEAEGLRERLLERSRLARQLLGVVLVLVTLLFAYDLSLQLGIAPDGIVDVPPRSALWERYDPGGSKFAIVSGPFHVPSAGVAWVTQALNLLCALVVWRWALHASVMNVRLHVPGPGRQRPRRLYLPELAWFGLLLSAMAAACHYAALLWRHSAPGAALGRLDALPIAWCTAYVLQALCLSGAVRIGGSLPVIVLGLAFWLVSLGLGIVTIRRIDARLLQRLAWVRQLAGSAPTPS